MSRRGLAGAGRPDDRDHLAARDFQVDGVERDHLALPVEVLGHPGERDHQIQWMRRPADKDANLIIMTRRRVPPHGAELPRDRGARAHEPPDFRVRGKIFATLSYPDSEWGMVKLSPEQQQNYLDAAPDVFEPAQRSVGTGRGDHGPAQGGEEGDREKSDRDSVGTGSGGEEEDVTPPRHGAAAPA